MSRLNPWECVSSLQLCKALLPYRLDSRRHKDRIALQQTLQVSSLTGSHKKLLCEFLCRKLYSFAILDHIKATRATFSICTTSCSLAAFLSYVYVCRAGLSPKETWKEATEREVTAAPAGCPESHKNASSRLAALCRADSIHLQAMTVSHG